MATAKLTLGALFATVGDAAAAVSTTLSTATEAVGIADDYVKDYRHNLRTRIAAKQVGYAKQIAMQTQMEVQQQKIAVDEFVTKHDCAEEFNSGVEEIMAAIAKANA